MLLRAKGFAQGCFESVFSKRRLARAETDVIKPDRFRRVDRKLPLLERCGAEMPVCVVDVSCFVSFALVLCIFLFFVSFLRLRIFFSPRAVHALSFCPQASVVQFLGDVGRVYERVLSSEYGMTRSTIHNFFRILIPLLYCVFRSWCKTSLTWVVIFS